MFMYFGYLKSVNSLWNDLQFNTLDFIKIAKNFQSLLHSVFKNRCCLDYFLKRKHVHYMVSPRVQSCFGFIPLKTLVWVFHALGKLAFLCDLFMSYDRKKTIELQVWCPLLKGKQSTVLSRGPHLHRALCLGDQGQEWVRPGRGTQAGLARRPDFLIRWALLPSISQISRAGGLRLVFAGFPWQVFPQVQADMS